MAYGKVTERSTGGKTRHTKRCDRTLSGSRDELAHYSKATTDLMYEFPHGLEELRASQIEQTLIWARMKNQEEFEIKSRSKTTRIRITN